MGNGLWFIVHKNLLLMGYLFFIAFIKLICACRRFRQHGIPNKFNRSAAIT